VGSDVASEMTNKSTTRGAGDTHSVVHEVIRNQVQEFASELFRRKLPNENHHYGSLHKETRTSQTRLKSMSQSQVLNQK
jgi:hypothetical protein